MFKFLDGAGCTHYKGEPFAYNLPRNNQKWATTRHPEPADYDGAACGAGRLHLMKRLDAKHAPISWWPWWAQGIGLIGGDTEKEAFAAVRLRRIYPQVLHRALRPPFNWGRGANLYGANLYGADLRGADLRGADLRGADLRGANLEGANLEGANLEWANLYGANLRGANLRRANLSGANLRGANLREADLRGANLYGANLRGANLEWANLRGANLYGADLRGANLYGANLQGANLYGANLEGANLEGTNHNEYTEWSDGFNMKEEVNGSDNDLD